MRATSLNWGCFREEGDNTKASGSLFRGAEKKRKRDPRAFLPPGGTKTIPSALTKEIFNTYINIIIYILYYLIHQKFNTLGERQTLAFLPDWAKYPVSTVPEH